MEIYGYGYRKNVFGESVFFEDRMHIADKKEAKKVFAKAFRMVRDRWDFSFNVCVGRKCWSVMCRDDDKDNFVYTLVYSDGNYMEAEQKVAREALVNAWMNELED